MYIGHQYHCWHTAAERSIGWPLMYKLVVHGNHLERSDLCQNVVTLLSLRTATPWIDAHVDGICWACWRRNWTPYEPYVRTSADNRVHHLEMDRKKWVHTNFVKVNHIHNRVCWNLTIEGFIKYVNVKADVEPLHSLTSPTRHNSVRSLLNYVKHRLYTY